MGRVFVRDYTALTVVFCGALLVSALNLRVSASSDSMIGRLFGAGTPYVQTQPLRTVTRNLAFAPIPVGLVRKIEQEYADGNAYMGMGYATVSGTDIAGTSKEDIEIYTIKDGDTIAQIAREHNVTVDTILWANEISDVSRIKPGDTIIILATNGLQHTVASGDTIDSIAKKYKASRDAIISYNGLPANGEITVGTKIVIPDGIKEEGGVPQGSQYALERRTYTSVNVAKQTAVSRSYYARPLASYKRSQGLHRTNAIDMATPTGSSVMAAAPGTVLIARGGWNGGYGNYVVIAHDNGTKTLYAHNSRLLVKTGDTVDRGQVIARSGSTGRSTGPHLHFEVRGARNPF